MLRRGNIIGRKEEMCSVERNSEFGNHQIELVWYVVDNDDEWYYTDEVG